CGVVSRRKSSNDCGFSIVGRLQAGGNDLGLLVTAPIIIEFRFLSLGVKEGQRRVLEGIGDAEWRVSQARSDGTQDHGIAIRAVDNEDPDHDAVTSPDQTASGDVAQTDRSGRVPVENFDQANAGPIYSLRLQSPCRRPARGK